MTLTERQWSALMPRLNGEIVEHINEFLRPGRCRPKPTTLRQNSGLCYNGSLVGGLGFTLTPEERDALIHRNRRNAERIFPYLGGEEVNTSPTQSFDRYVINFGDMTLEEAGQWPDLLEIVREKVKPERDKNNQESRRRYWWRFGGGSSPGLYGALRGLSRCLVNSVVSKHLIFAWQPTDRVFSSNLYVYPLIENAYFSCLQSRIHEAWARLLSSTLGETLKYVASECFATFPFPRADRLTSSGELDRAGAQLDEARARYMLETCQGLTKTYNALKDRTNRDQRIEHLRELHEDLDRATLATYGWSDLGVPAYTDPAQAWRSEVIDRLYDLNAQYSREEQ